MKTIELIKIGPETEAVTETYTDENDTEQTREVQRPVETVLVAATVDDDRLPNAVLRYGRQAQLENRNATDGAKYTHRVSG